MSIARYRRFAALAVAVAVTAGCTSIAGAPQVTTPAAPSPADPSPEVVAPDADLPVVDPHDPSGEREPTSIELIAAALEAGEIDEPTSWLYRTWVTFADAQLPEEFVGAPDGHDIELLAELPARLDELPDDVRAQIEPYFLRPTDPRSIHSAAADSDGGDGDPPGIRAAGDALTQPQAPAPADAGDPEAYWNQCHEGWDTQVVPGVPFRVWACRDLNYVDLDDETATTDGMKALSEVLARHAPKMIADMGDVIRDDPDANPDPRSDDLIDFYLVAPGRQAVERHGQKSLLKFAGSAVSTYPYTDTTGSSFVLVSAEMLGDPDKFAWSVVHELFHVLQYTHNMRLGPNWFYDATADWAVTYYLRGTTSAAVHQQRLPVKHKEWSIPLTANWGLHPYGAYLWPLFMEQQAGAQSIFATWRALAGLPRGKDDAALLAVVNDQVPVAKNYPEFAVRLLNAQGLPGDPISPRFVHLDSTFPDGDLPDLIADTLGEDRLLAVFTMPGLTYRPYRIAVPAMAGRSPDDGILVQVEGQLQGKGVEAPILEGVIRGSDGAYQRQRISYLRGDTICVAEDMFLVLANPDLRQDPGVTGQFTLKRLKEDDQVTDRTCTRVEVNHPEWLHPLTDGEPVTVDGREDDGEPDDTAIVVSVYDVDPATVQEYQVEVTVTGETLASERLFVWPLSDFEEVGIKQWRRQEPLPLDIDLTDLNRPLTIDARLSRVGRHIHQHTPTIELHGEKTCRADDPDDVCELVGDLFFTFSGSYDGGSNIHPRLYASADIEATLHVRLQESDRPGGELQPVTYVDAGSSWELSGSARFEECGTIGTETCPGPVEQTFTAAGNTSAPDRDWTLTDLRFSVVHGALIARFPVTVTSHGPWDAGDAPVEPVMQETWDIGCAEPPEDDEYGGRFWESGNSYTSNVFHASEVWSPGIPLTDASSGQSAAFVVDCSRTWSTQDFNLSRSNGSAAVTVTVSGTLRSVSAGG